MSLTVRQGKQGLIPARVPYCQAGIDSCVTVSHAGKAAIDSHVPHSQGRCLTPEPWRWCVSLHYDYQAAERAGPYWMI